MTSEVIKEWLSKLTFQVDTNAIHKFTGYIETAAKAAVGLAAAIESAAMAMTAAMVNMSRHMEDLQYAAARGNTTSTSLRAFGFAASQLGSSTTEAVGAVENLGRRLRESPGYENMLHNLGVQTRDNTGHMRDGVDVLRDLAKVISTKPTSTQYSIIDQLGIPENLLRAMQGGEFDAQLKRWRDKMKAAQLDPEEAAANAQKLMRAWRDFGASIDIIFSKVIGKLAAMLGGDFTRVTDWIDSHSEEIANKIIQVATKIFELADGILKVLIPAVEKMLPVFRQVWDDVVIVVKHLDQVIDKTIGWKTALEALLAFIVGSWFLGITGALRGIAGTIASLGLSMLFTPAGMALLGGGAIAAGSLAATQSNPAIAGAGAGGVSPLPEVAEGAPTKEGGAMKAVTGGLKKAWNWVTGKKDEATPSRNLSGGSAGDPKLVGLNKDLVADFLAAEKATGIRFSVNQGLRTPEEAAANARSGIGVRNSQHLYGAAADLRLYDEHGNITRDRAVYKRFADAYEAASKARGGRGRWLGNLSGRWGSDIWHFDQGIGYGQTHKRDPYTGPETPTAAHDPHLVDARTVPLNQRTPFGVYRDVDPKTIKSPFGNLDAGKLHDKFKSSPFGNLDVGKFKTSALKGHSSETKENHFDFDQNVQVHIGGADRGPATKNFDLAGPRPQADLLRNLKPRVQ